MDDRLRALWQDLAERYQFLYRLTLQERLSEMRQDVGDWWWVGGLSVPGPAGPTLLTGRAGPSHASVARGGPRRSSPPRALVSLADAEPDDERPLSGLPDGVKRIILEVADESGVSPAEIMSGKTTRRIYDARRACALRMKRQLRFGGGRGGGPSQAQIGVWLRRDHSTIARMLEDR